MRTPTPFPPSNTLAHALLNLKCAHLEELFVVPEGQLSQAASVIPFQNRFRLARIHCIIAWRYIGDVSVLAQSQMLVLVPVTDSECVVCAWQLFHHWRRRRQLCCRSVRSTSDAFKMPFNHACSVTTRKARNGRVR